MTLRLLFTGIVCAHTNKNRANVWFIGQDLNGFSLNMAPGTQQVIAELEMESPMTIVVTWRERCLADKEWSTWRSGVDHRDPRLPI